LSAYQSFYVKPSDNELVETVVHIKPDPRPSIVGAVLDRSEKPVSDAFVVLFEADIETETEKALSSVFTDERGGFMFGPLKSGQLYMVKIFHREPRQRFLDLDAGGA